MVDNFHTKIRKPFSFGTLNCKSLNVLDGRLFSLLNYVKVNNLSMLALQEHFLPTIYNNPLSHVYKKDVGDYQISYNKFCGFIMPACLKIGKIFSSIDGRVLIIRLKAKDFILVDSVWVSFYSPTNVAEQDKREEFWSNFQTLIDLHVKKHDACFFGGDANARLGSDVLGEARSVNACYTETNENGLCLFDLMQKSNLVHASSLKQHAWNQKWTWRHLSSKKNSS